jgi:hypothetical protein
MRAGAVLLTVSISRLHHCGQQQQQRRQELQLGAQGRGNCELSPHSWQL